MGSGGRGGREEGGDTGEEQKDHYNLPQTKDTFLSALRSPMGVPHQREAQTSWPPEGSRIMVPRRCPHADIQDHEYVILYDKEDCAKFIHLGILRFPE